MSQYNPAIHHRRSIRLKGYDYSQEGLYFITICCQSKISRFGKIENGKMKLNEFGIIAHNEWLKLAERFPNFALDAFQIMPDHMHGIIQVRAPLAGAPASDANDSDADEMRAGASPAPARARTRASAPTVSDIVGAYKSLVANGCLPIYKSRNETMGKLWQRNYYERIIRNENAYQRISQYIIDNPAKWTRKKILF